MLMSLEEMQHWKFWCLQRRCSLVVLSLVALFLQAHFWCKFELFWLWLFFIFCINKITYFLSKVVLWWIFLFSVWVLRGELLLWRPGSCNWFLFYCWVNGQCCCHLHSSVKGCFCLMMLTMDCYEWQLLCHPLHLTMKVWAMIFGLSWLSILSPRMELD